MSKAFTESKNNNKNIKFHNSISSKEEINNKLSPKKLRNNQIKQNLMNNNVYNTNRYSSSNHLFLTNNIDSHINDKEKKIKKKHLKEEKCYKNNININ